MGVVETCAEDEFAALLAGVGVTSADDLPPAEVAGSEPQDMGESLQRQTITRGPATVVQATAMVANFRDHIQHLGLSLDPAVVIDLLASYLSSQVLLFAGPSGTGKSTAARAVQTFFATADSRSSIDGRRQLLGPEDVAGYFSPLGGGFVAGPDLAALQHLARPNLASPCPSLLLEEINLSPPEGYLSPLIHGFSGLSTESVLWQMFSPEHETAAGRPGHLEFAPFPRLLGTINVDSTAPPPAPKVAARACVILLEPSSIDDLLPALDDLSDHRDPTEPAANGAHIPGDPLAIFGSTDCAERRTLIADASAWAAAGVEHGDVVDEEGWSLKKTPISVLSRRQLGQVLLYTSWFDLVSRGAAENGLIPGVLNPRIGAENAILHFVLPSLDAVIFSEVVSRLDGLDLSDTDEAGSGILRSRLNRLAAADRSVGFSRTLDFWDRLS